MAEYDETADYWRQLKIFNPLNHLDQKIALIGAGASGSWIALVLAKMGMKDITVWDADIVEPHNLPNQIFPINSIGQSKVGELNNLLGFMTETVMTTFNQNWTPTDSLEDYSIIINTPDSMRARKLVWDAVKFTPKTVYIETRMGGETMRIYTVDPMNPTQVEAYEKTLYDDKDAEDLPCSATTIVYNSVGIAGFVANQVKKALTEDKELFNEIIFDYKCMLMETRKW